MKHLVCLVVSFLFTGLIAKYAHKLKLIDIPSGRSSHVQPTPKGGGIGILCAFLITSIAAVPVFFWLPAAILSLVSLKNDIIDLSPKIRLIVQFLMAFVVLFGVGARDYFAWNLFSLTILVTCLLFIVATANFYNFMDGINGIAGLTGVVSFLLLGVFLQDFEPNYAMLCFSVTVSCVGFLPFNIPKAKVFMGDVGSILLGFVFAATIVLTSRNMQDFLFMSSFLLLFYLDEFASMIKRIKDGKSLLRAHREHLYQILVNEGGIAHWKVSVGYALCQLVIGGLVLCLQACGVWFVMLAILIFSFIFYCFDSFIRRRYCIN